MNQTQFAGIARIIMTATAAIFGTLGYLKGVNWEPIIGAAVTVGVAWWSHHSNKTETMAVTVANSPEVKGIVVSPKLVSDAPDLLANSKVTIK